MRRSWGLALRLRDDPAVVAEYRRAHQHAWPSVVRRLREIGVFEMKIFLRDQLLFMYLETGSEFDPARDFDQATLDPEYRRWSTLMAAMQEPIDDAREDEWWAAMEPVFDLNWPEYREL